MSSICNSSFSLWKISLVIFLQTLIQNHRITKIGRDLQNYPVQLSTKCDHNHPYTKSPSAISRYHLNTSRDGGSTTYLCSPFQCFDNPYSGKKQKTFQYLIWTSSSANWGRVFSSFHLIRVRRDEALPHYNFLSGSCREQWGLIWASFPPHQTAPAASAAPHTNKTSAPDSTLALLCCSGWTPAPQCPLWNERPKTKHNSKVVASPVLSTAGQCLP